MAKQSPILYRQIVLAVYAVFKRATIRRDSIGLSYTRKQLSNELSRLSNTGFLSYLLLLDVQKKFVFSILPSHVFLISQHTC